jgi:predicted nucleotidyltransferase
MREFLTPRILNGLRVMQNDLQKWYYTRELADLSKTGRTTISDEFPNLVKQGILNRRVEGREVYYRFNLGNIKARKLCELFETERRDKLYQQNKRLSWALQEFSKRVFDLLPEIQSVILFGSAARGQLTKTSDVDLLVLVPNLEQGPFNELMKSVDKLAADTRGKYGFQLSAVLMTIREFEAGFRERKRITRDVAREGIVLFGEDRYYTLLSRLIS